MAGNDNLIELTGVWLNTSEKTGNKYMSGKLRKGLTVTFTGENGEVLELGEGTRVLMFKNNKRPDKKDPDYRLYIARPDEDQGNGGHEPPPPIDEDIPF